MNLNHSQVQVAVDAAEKNQLILKFASIGVLDPKLAHKIVPAVGACNMLVHEYDDPDTQLFYDNLKMLRDTFQSK